MTAQQLRNSILQQAIQGRLVPQDPNDEPASVLLERIRKEKEQLVKEGKLKKKDLVTTPIADDEKPFDIPSGWEWCRLGDLGVFERGNGIKKDETCINGYPCVRYGEMYTKYRHNATFDKTFSFTSEKVFNQCRKAHTGDLFMALTGENKQDIALAAQYIGAEEVAVGGDLCHFTILRAYALYFVYLINSPYFCGQKQFLATGDIIVHISADKLGSIPIPLPPLAEQRRIVAKIEELMPLVEKYGKAQTELDTLNQDLPRRLRQSVLQQAIQGKLVEQDPNDEPASVLLERIRKEKEQLVKEGKLKKKDLATTPIADDEKPFDIPSGWEWCNLGNILSIVTGKKDANQGCENGPYPFFTCSMTPIRSTTYSFEGEAILLPGNGANVGMSILYDGKFEVYQRTYVLQSLCDNCLFLPYIKLALDWNWKQYNDDKLYGSAIPYIKLSNLQNYIFPLPPLAEQRRIVAKIEELFAEIDKLK